MSGPRPIARMLPEIAGKVLGKKGLALGALINEWEAVVGPETARRAIPAKLAFPAGRRDGATLHLRVTGGAALEIQHAMPQLIDRMNSFFGYRAIGAVKLVQAGVSSRPRRPILRPLAPSEVARVAGSVSGIQNEELREALAAFGAAVLAGRR